MKKTLDSGAELDMTMASFAEGHKLLKCVLCELQSIDLKFGSATIEELQGKNFGDGALNTIKNTLARLASSQIVEEAIWPCMGRCTYNNQKISPPLFEDTEIRSDFLVVAKEVLWFNLAPFFKNLRSQLKVIVPVVPSKSPR